MTLFIIIRTLIACALVGVCVYTDLKERKIFNKITISGMLAGLILNTIFQATPNLESGLLFSIQGLALGLILFFIPFTLGGLGAGDLKMLGMIGAIQGWPFIGWTGLYGAIAGGLVSLYVMLVNKKVRGAVGDQLTSLVFSAIHALKFDISKVQGSGYRFPYSIAIAAGMLLTILFKM